MSHWRPTGSSPGNEALDNYGVGLTANIDTWSGDKDVSYEILSSNETFIASQIIRVTSATLCSSFVATL